MTLIYFIISSTTSIISRTFKGINKSIILIASILIVIPTLYDWNELDI